MPQKYKTELDERMVLQSKTEAVVWRKKLKQDYKDGSGILVSASNFDSHYVLYFSAFSSQSSL